MTETFGITPESHPDIWAVLQPPDSSPQRSLTDKEHYVVEAFESARPGGGVIAESNILNPNSGWRETIADMDESEIVCREGSNSNKGFMYRHIGH